jgi:hypothetical protein
LQQVGGGGFDLQESLASDIRHDQRLVIDLEIGFRSTSLRIEAAGDWPNRGSIGPSTKCLAMTTSNWYGCCGSFIPGLSIVKITPLPCPPFVAAPRRQLLSSGSGDRSPENFRSTPHQPGPALAQKAHRAAFSAHGLPPPTFSVPAHRTATSSGRPAARPQAAGGEC